MDGTELLKHKALIGVTVLVVAVVAAVFFWMRPQPLHELYHTQPLTKGELIQSVSANGTLNPVILVNVGTQISGVVKKIHADFNDAVSKGQILLELDASLYQAQLAQSQAMVAAAEASVELARANSERTQALYSREYVAKQDLDTVNQVLKSALAQLKQAKAQARRDKINLEYTIIRSPVAGVVVSREVDVGQTVAASFQTPTLFRIAQDLTRMQIDSSFSEADIGTIRVGQPSRFTVDAFQNREFSGTVRQLRLNPTTQQNVVTYNVVIDVSNDEGILLPGMTAYVSVITAKLQDVLKVPNAALRFRPAVDALLERVEQSPLPSQNGGIHGTAYMLGESGLRPLRLLLGASDNNDTQVLAGPLQAGDQVVVEAIAADAKRKARARVH